MRRRRWVIKGREEGEEGGVEKGRCEREMVEQVNEEVEVGEKKMKMETKWGEEEEREIDEL